jgi:WD40 repeat protein
LSIQDAAELSFGSSGNTDLNSTATSRPNQGIVAHLPTTTSHSSPFANTGPGPSQPTATSISEADVSPTQLGHNHPDWSVEYNHEIQQTVSLHVVKTFTCPAMVFCASFSRDGKYLALGFHNGEIHIYDMKTGSKRSIFCVTFSLD